MTQLDTSIVERYAAHLRRKASSCVMRYSIAFALLGACLGSVTLIAPNRVLVPPTLGLALLLVGAAAGGYLGYTIGVRRAEGLRLQAELTLHQLQVEQVLVQPAAALAPAPALPPLAAPAVAPPLAAAPAFAPVLAAAPPAPAPAPVAPAPATPPPALVPPAPFPAPVAATPPRVETGLAAVPPPVRPAMPPLSAPAESRAFEAPAPGHVPEGNLPEERVAAPTVAAVPASPSVPHLVEARPASEPARLPPVSAEHQ
jgi:hypothetical protein